MPYLVEEDNIPYVVYEYPWGGQKKVSIMDRELFIDSGMVKIKFEGISENTLSRVTDGVTFKLFNKVFFLTEEEQKLAEELQVQANYSKVQYEWECRKKWSKVRRAV